jgi:exodeoxyribonuclease VII large subunit
LLEKRRRSLALEGLFDEERKKPIPRFPETIGVVTSPRGAAIRDIVQVLSRRAGGLRVIVFPAPVQGEEAGGIIARRIEQANQWKLVDVLIVGRGGGAVEDLLPFSEEGVVRAIAASEIPVISAVGHEIDWALSDFAADLRAPTPSAAAELVCENYAAIRAGVCTFEKHLFNAMASHVNRAHLLLRQFDADYMEQRFRSRWQPFIQRCDDAKEALVAGMRRRAEAAESRLAMLTAALENASPRAVLERGYALVMDADSGAVIRRAAAIRPDAALVLRFVDGTVQIKVKSDGTAGFPRTV